MKRTSRHDLLDEMLVNYFTFIAFITFVIFLISHLLCVFFDSFLVFNLNMRYWRQLRQFKPVLTLNVVVAVGLLCWLMFSDYGLRAEFERRVVDVDVKPYVNPSKSPSSSVGSDVTTIPSSAAPKKSHATIVKPLKLEPEAIEEDVTNGRGMNKISIRTVRATYLHSLSQFQIQQP
jgi:hypothetical protein